MMLALASSSGTVAKHTAPKWGCVYCVSLLFPPRSSLDSPPSRPPVRHNRLQTTLKRSPASAFPPPFEGCPVRSTAIPSGLTRVRCSSSCRQDRTSNCKSRMADRRRVRENVGETKVTIKVCCEIYTRRSGRDSDRGDSRRDSRFVRRVGFGMYC